MRTKKKVSKGPKRASTIKAKTGKGGKGAEFNPSDPTTVAMAARVEETRKPRPYLTRYPIPEEQFRKLKEKAGKIRLAIGKTTLSQDAGAKTEVSAAPAQVALHEAPAAPAAAPSSASHFAGISATGWIPPDCTMAAGPKHVVLSVNSSIAIYNKTGGAAQLQRTLTAWFANVIQGATIFDPKLLFDQQAARWVLLAAAVSSNPNRSAYLLSVSATDNPLGPWRNYSLDATVDGATATNNWADYPSLGVDSHALYITSNQFVFNGNFAYAKVRVVPKSGPYSGGVATFFDFVNLTNADGTQAFTVQPCHTYGAPQVEYLVNSAFPNGNYLTVWQIAQSGSSFVMNSTQVTTAPYSLPPNADQKGNNDPLNSGDVRIQHAVFRGDSIWCALTTARSWAAGSSQAAIHWFQIRAAASTLVQEGVYGAANIHYFYPACCPDNNGNMIMVFSRCSGSEFGSIYFTGRRATDALGTLQSSSLLKAGMTNYVAKDDSGRNRWGDYAGVAADPSNARGIWFYSLFAAAANAWGTWVGSAFL
jgi:hypothetical protein